VSDQFVYTTLRDPRVGVLLEGMTFEWETRYGEWLKQQEGPPELERYPPEAFEPPHGNFLLLIRDDKPIAGGAFIRYDEKTAEFKRIWTRPDTRRRGLARRVVAELEAQSARQGYTRIYLTTGFRQPEAVALYLRLGYTALFDFPVDPDVPRALPFEKHLARGAGEQ
jgi:GNAT superfamily N-acetyltransferase